MAVVTIIIIILLIPIIQELIRWIILVGIHISIFKLDVDDGVSLALPQAPNKYVASSF